MQSQTFETTIGGKKMIAEFTDLAEQANGSVLLRHGDTAVFATAVMSEKTRDDIDYFPLTVDYEERFYAAGKMPGGRYVRREGKPSDQGILSGRVVDRTIRPLFPHHIRNEIHVVITVLALGEEDPDTVAVNAASLALATSDIPWAGPVAAARIAKQGGEELIVNPTYAERADEATMFEILACGKDGTINMIEVGAKEASEADIAAGLAKAALIHDDILAFQKKIIEEIGKPKHDAAKPELPAALTELYDALYAEKVRAAVFSGAAGKDAIHALQREWGVSVAGVELLKDLKSGAVKRFLEDKVDEEIHRGAVEEDKRADGRGFADIRQLYAKAGGISDVLHGSGIFYRGGTHVFTALTLGGPEDSLSVDSMEAQDVKQRFMHHYNFPPYSVGETGRMGGTNRRMIGHGALAQKALQAVIPPASEFPYTIRLVSECLASNGSTSMGSVCASTLALMDGGVPIKAPVAGIAMGLMLSTEYAKDKKYKVLTDIQGPEDEYGDMDFKVAGTRNGVTAIQMDIKLDGVPLAILTEALEGAKAARLQILDVIEAEIALPRAALSSRAPEIITLRIKPEQIGLVIGGGGKTINGIKNVSGVEDITIEDDGSVFIAGKNGTAQKAREMVEALVKEYLPGETYDGEVTRMMDFGAFVRIGTGKNAEGLVHVSEIAPFHIEKPEDALAVGEKVRVMIKEVDEKGRLNLSIKMVDPEFAARKGIIPPTHTNGGTERQPDTPGSDA